MRDPRRADSGSDLHLPPSVTSFRLNLIALGALFVTLYVLRQYHLPTLKAMLILLGAVAVPVILIDVLVLRVYRNPSAGLDWDASRPPDLRRVATKLLGLALTLALI